MSDPFIGEIRLFPYTFAPLDWEYCDGRLMPIAQFQALYAVIGNSYGGTAPSTFALPDLRGRVAVGTGNDPSDFFHPPFATNGGAESVTLTLSTIPPHSHTLNAAVTPPATRVAPPGGNYITVLTGNTSAPFINDAAFTSATNPVTPVQMNSGTISIFNSGSAAHENRQPYQALVYCICCQNGIFPVRPS